MSNLAPTPMPIEETDAPPAAVAGIYPADQSWRGTLAARRAAASLPLEQRAEPVGPEVYDQPARPAPVDIDAIAEKVAERLVGALERRAAAESTGGAPDGPRGA